MSYQDKWGGMGWDPEPSKDDILSDPELEPTGILWILVRDVQVTGNRDGDVYMVTELDGNGRTCVISITPKGRYLFNGEDIETEDFMAYVGMLDYVNESPNRSATFRNDVVTND